MRGENLRQIDWIRLVVCFALLGNAVTSTSAEVQTLITDAISNGHAQGVLTGKMADAFARTTHSSDPVTAKIRVLKRYGRPDCARLQFELTQTNVPTKEGKRVPFTSAFEMNLCADGTPPLETLDLSKLPTDVSAK